MDRLEVWLSGDCQGFYITRPETESALQARLGDADVSIFAVYLLDSYGGLDTDHIIVVRDQNALEAAGGDVVSLLKGKVVAYETTCGTVASKASALEDQGAEVVISPRGG